jgi:probable F420-dependent oxidoreductase
MALKDRIALGMSLPHRSPDGIEAAVVRQVAQRSEALGFQDLWVTDNIIDPARCMNALTILTYAAGLTSKIKVGVSVLVLPIYHPIHVAHQVATLDYLSDGRAIVGVGLGRYDEYPPFQISPERRVRRFIESIELMKALWTEEDVQYRGEIFQLEGGALGTKPVQKPHPPIWVGGHHADAIRRAARVADGWMGAGGSSKAAFGAAVPLLRDALTAAGRDPDAYPISKRVFLSVHERPDVARAEVDRWYTEVYKNPDGVNTSGVHGTPEQVKVQLEELASLGASHLLLNPVARYAENTEALAEIVGLA